MKKKDITKAIGDISDKYLMEAMEGISDTVTENSREVINMKSRNIFSFKKFAGVAVAACLILSLVVTSFMNGAGGDNLFTMEVYADELSEDQAVYIVQEHTDGWAFETREDGTADYCISLPITCKGNNIDKITYTVSDAYFQIAEPKDSSLLIDGKAIEEDLNTASIGGDTNLSGDNVSHWGYYTSYTVDYDKQTDSHTWVNLCDIVEMSDDAKSILFGSGSSDAECAQVINDMLEGTVISCTVTYEDGTTETKNIKVSATATTYKEANIKTSDENAEHLFIKFELNN